MGRRDSHVLHGSEFSRYLQQYTTRRDGSAGCSGHNQVAVRPPPSALRSPLSAFRPTVVVDPRNHPEVLGPS